MHQNNTPKKIVRVLTRGIGQCFVEGMDVPLLHTHIILHLVRINASDADLGPDS